MLSKRQAALWLFLAVERVLTVQIPLSLYHHEISESSDLCSHLRDDTGQWDIDEPPAMNATGNLVFETANSLLQHWTNTRYRIGRL